MDLRRLNSKTDPVAWIYLGIAFQVVLVVLILADAGPPAAAFAGATIGCLISARRVVRQPGELRR